MEWGDLRKKIAGNGKGTINDREPQLVVAWEGLFIAEIPKLCHTTIPLPAENG